MAIFTTLCMMLTTMAAVALAATSNSSSLITFVFGDSLPEVGNNNFLQSSLARSNYPWYGIDYEGGRPTGRFTNGRTIASKLGVPSPPPYLSLSNNDDALLKGVNYASGGAGILNETGTYFIQRLTFDDQIDYFKKTKERIRAKIGEEAANKLFNEAMYFVGIGITFALDTRSNDYVNNYLQPFLPDAQKYTHDEFLELLGSNLDHQLSSLYQLGARKVIFYGLGPLGCIPSQRVKSKTGQCLKKVNEMVLEFNSKVKQLFVSLNRRLPSAKFLFADTYQDVFDLIDKPYDYGFKVSNKSCCNVASLGGLCLPNSRLCSNRREYVFWDNFHPTDAANEVLAEKLFASLFSAPPPNPN